MKLKRLISALLVITMLLTQLPLTVFADGEAAEEMQTETYIPEDVDQLDNDELFAGYVDKMFYDGIATYGTLAREHLPTALEKRVYDLLKAEIEKIACGQRTSTEIVIQMSQLKDVAISDAYSEFGASDSGLLMQALLADCPYDLYWFDKTSGWRRSWNSSKATFYIHVADNYQGDGDYVVSSNVAAISTAVSNAKSIVNENAGKTDYRKLLAYKNKICNLVEYDFNAAAAGNFFQDDDPWQLIHVFDGDPNTKVVCEGYSKAMQYLCDMSTFNGDVFCYSVSGYMNGGAHMWNTVHIGGQNYLLDVTNSDTGTSGADGRYFLAGASGSVQGGYTIKGASFVYKDKTINLWGTEALTLAGSNYVEPAYDSISIMDADVTLSQNEYVYDGSAKTPVVTVSKNGVTLTQNVHYFVSYSDNVNAGTATITINGTGNYYGSTYQYFTIKKATPVIYDLVCKQELTTSNSILDVVVSGSASTDGTLYFDENQVLKAGTYAYTYIFIPTDSNNYETITGSMLLTVKAVDCDHWLIEIPAKAATCTEDGLTQGWSCLVCGEITTPQEVIPASHQPKVLDAKAATCTEDGLTEGSYCTVCGEVLIEQTAVPATGHSAGSGTIEKAATCTEDGLKKIFCGYCNILMNAEVIPATGHSYLDGVCISCGAKEFGEDIVASGICGDNAEWVLDIDGTLDISGSGAMYNYKLSSNVAPWKAYASQVKCIMIEEGITSVGDCTFVGCYNATELILPDSVSYIGGYAFDGCSKLTEIMLPEAVDAIGCGAFRNCSSLREIYLPKAIECSVMYDDIQYDTFAGCTNLTDVCFGGTAVEWANISINESGNAPLLNATIHIGKKHSSDPDPVLGGSFDGYTWTFENGTLTISGSGSTSGFIYDNVQITIPWYGLAIEHIVIEEGVTVIGCNAFNHCGDIQSVTLPKSLRYIDSFAFNDCTPAEIYYAGSASDFAAISIGECNYGIVEENVEFGEEETLTYTPYINGQPVTGVVEGKVGEVVKLTIVDNNGQTHPISALTLTTNGGIEGYPNELRYTKAGVWTIGVYLWDDDTTISVKFHIEDAPMESYTPYINGQPVTDVIEGEVGDIFDLYFLSSSGTVHRVRSFSANAENIGIAFTGVSGQLTATKAGTWTIEITVLDGSLALETPMKLTFNIKEKTTPSVQLGEVNGSGDIDNIDAMLVLQYAVGLLDDAAINSAAADVNGDGFVDNIDAMLILQYAVGLIDHFPASNK